MVKYNCRWCNWVYEGHFKNGVIPEHDATHIENSVESFIERHKEYGNSTTKFCSHCGCTEDHEHTDTEKARSVGGEYPEIKID